VGEGADEGEVPVVSFHCPGSFTREGEGVRHGLIEETMAGEGTHQEWGGSGAGDQR
jgi:hypothetical protein